MMVKLFFLPSKYVGEAVAQTYYIKVSTGCGDNTDYNNYSTSPNCSFKYNDTDDVDISLEENKEDVNYFDVIDLYGRTLFSGKNYSSNHLLLKKLNTGIYVIKLYNENYDYLQSFQVFVSN